MAFGQQSGPPASHRQVQAINDLVVAAGHRDLRDARGVLQLTQRQAGGKFTRDEADALIARLEAEAQTAATGSSVAVPATGRATPPTVRTVPKLSLRRVPDELLAAELQRRGWIVVAP